MDLVVISVGLGLLGIDIIGALIMLAALAIGMSRRQALTFSLIVLVGTIIYGVLLSILVGEGVNAIAEYVSQISADTWKLVEILVIILLGTWVYRRILKRTEVKQKDKVSKFRKSLEHGVVLTAIAFVLGAVFDPSFLALVVASGRDGMFVHILAAQSLWVLISQLPLFALAIAVIFKKEQTITNWFNKIRKSSGKKSYTSMTTLIALTGMILLTDVVIYFAF